MGHPHAIQGQIQSSPVAVDNIIYVGSLDYNLYAIDAKTGKEKWHYYMADNPVYSTPAYREGMLYYGTYGFHNPRVYALNTKGEKQWAFRRELESIKPDERLRIGSWDNEKYGFTASPVIAGNRMYIGSWDNHLYIFDLDRGELIGKYAAPKAIGAAAAVGDGVVYFGCYDGCIYALSGE